MTSGFNSIRVRLMVTGGIVLMLALGAMEGTSHYYANSYLSTSADETAQSIASDYAGRVQAQINEIMLPLEATASTSQMRNIEDQNMLKQTVGDTLKQIGKLAIDKISKANVGQTQTVSAATEQQSASMEEIAASSQDLPKMAQPLQNIISRFKN